MDERDVTPVMEALFDIRSRVVDIHEEMSRRRTTMGKPRKRKTREEWERERRDRDDLTRRLKERLEYHRARLAALEREGEERPAEG